MKAVNPYVKRQLENAASIVQIVRKYSDEHISSANDTTVVSESSSDNSSYQCKEYYSYSEFSYYDVDANCVEKRLPQPHAEFRDPNDPK